MVAQYQKPKITQKKIKLSFFLSNIAWLDQFNLTGTVYAQSGGPASNCDCGCQDSSSGNCQGCAGNCGCGGVSVSGWNPDTGSGPGVGGCSCNSACSCNPQSGGITGTLPGGTPVIGYNVSFGNCNSNSNCQGCSSGNDGNGGSGGHGGY